MSHPPPPGDRSRPVDPPSPFGSPAPHRPWQTAPRSERSAQVGAGSPADHPGSGTPCTRRKWAAEPSIGTAATLAVGTTGVPTRPVARVTLALRAMVRRTRPGRVSACTEPSAGARSSRAPGPALLQWHTRCHFAWRKRLRRKRRIR